MPPGGARAGRGQAEPPALTVIELLYHPLMACSVAVGWTS